MASPTDSLSGAAPEAAKPAKSTWETVLTLTPVVLTVLGTLLAGVSSSELTLAQYARTLAGQSQSKAGDQWAFFQAKRIRGQGLESSLDQLPVLARLDPVTPQTFESAADRLVQRLQQAEKHAQRLQQAVVAASLNHSVEPVRLAVATLVQTAGKDARQAQQAQVALNSLLAQSETRSAFAFLGTDATPQTKDTRLDNPKVEELLRAIADRKPEQEIAPQLHQLPAETVQQAIDAAEGNARGFEVACAPVSQVVRRIDQQVTAIVRPAVPVHQAAAAVDLALAGLPEDKGRPLDEVRSAAAALARSDDRVRAAAEELSNVAGIVRLDYDARRYRREADYNQRVAALYEIQVRQHSVASERHRDRSKMFFIGMLFAQAGVAIASMSLAARQRSVLWGLAGLAGSVAVAFSLYVYLYR